MPGPVRICFVCTANICRSPTAAAITRQLLEEAGMSDRVVVESAGTGSWRVGEEADAPAVKEARRRGYAMAGHTARQFTADDLTRFDLFLVMDWQNRNDLLALEPDAEQYARIRYLREYDATADSEEVPDPYGGGRKQFVRTFDMIEAACRGLVTRLMLGQMEPTQ